MDHVVPFWVRLKYLPDGVQLGIHFDTSDLEAGQCVRF